VIDKELAAALCTFTSLSVVGQFIVERIEEKVGALSFEQKDTLHLMIV